MRPHDVVLFYLAIPLGWNGAPANFAIFGDAIASMRAQFGMGRPDWFLPISSLSELYVGDGLFFDIGDQHRRRANTLVWESIAVGLLGPHALNVSKMEEECRRGAIRAMISFDINSQLMRITLPEAKIAGARVLFYQLRDKAGSRALEVVTSQQVRGHIVHFRDANAMWEFLTGPIDLLLRYTDEQANWVNFPDPEVWDSFWNSLSAVFGIMESEHQWRKIFQGNLLRLLSPEQRLSVHVDRGSSRFSLDRSIWESVDATLEIVGGSSCGGREFFGPPLSLSCRTLDPRIPAGH